MKKKLTTLLLCGMLAVTSTVPVLADEKDDRIAELEAQVADLEKTVEELQAELQKAKGGSTTPASKDGVNFETDTFTVQYTRHEFGTDYEGNKCLLYYYNFTNNSDQNTSAGMTAHVQCFQDGSECEMAIVADGYVDAMDNYVMNEAQPGGTVEVCIPYALKSDTEITIEVSDLMSMSDEKASQAITVE